MKDLVCGAVTPENAYDHRIDNLRETTQFYMIFEIPNSCPI